MITNTPPSQLRSVHTIFESMMVDSLSVGDYSCPLIHFPYFPLLLLFSMSKACLSAVLSFTLIFLFSLRLLKSDCPNYCNKALSPVLHKCLETQSSCKGTRSLIFIFGLLDTCCFVEWYSRRFTECSLRQGSQKCSIKWLSFWIVYNVTHNFIISQSFLLNIFWTYTRSKLSTHVVEKGCVSANQSLVNDGALG